ncbi:MAG: amidase domain-containing protein [Clostridia bacterium]|nr:amidase domain-containing protein [Clostridia bacterium]
MKKTVKRLISWLLCAVMIFGILPVSEIAGWDLGLTARAAGVSGYSAAAAAQWAKDHWNDYDSVILGTGYWYDGGDCANFVSQSLYMGGMDMDSYWNTNGYLAHWGTYYGSDYAGAFVRCQQLYNYLVYKGAQVIQNPSASQVSVGDVLLYSASGASRMTHSAIVIDIVNGTPIVAAHSVNGIRYTSYDGRDWHLGFEANRTYLMKLYGDICVNQKSRSFDVYTASGGDLKLYNAASAASGYSRTFQRGEYAHIYATTNANGYKWGYTFRYGAWGWVKLSSFSYQRHIDAVRVSHDFGGWYTVTVANCQRDGLERHTCKRCGYSEDRSTKGGHVTDPSATCLTPGICKICGAQTQNPIGHQWDNGTVTTAPTCVEKGIRTYTCKQDASHTYTEIIPALGHDYVATPTAPTCVQDGISTMVCSRCGDTYVIYTDENNTWSAWTETSPAEVGITDDFKVMSKTQYRYRTKSTTTSYETSLNGWTQNGGSWVQSGNGSKEYAPGKTTALINNGLFAWIDTSAYSSYENATNKRTVNNNFSYYVYYHWCRGTYSAGPINRAISTVEGPNSEFNAFHWFSSNTNIDFNSSANCYQFANADACKDTYWYHRFEVYSSSYVDYRMLFNYYKWSDWSAWQDASVTATSDKQVQTRTVYSYDLAALGHDFSVAGEKKFVAEPKLLSDAELYDDCYTEGTVCSRCGAASPNNVVAAHDIPDFNFEQEQYTLITDEADPVQVWRAYCRNGCGCYYDVSINTCEWSEEVIAPTCAEDGYVLHTCAVHGETFKTDTVPSLGHDMSGEWIITKTPTCTQPGEMKAKCARYDVCGHAEEKEIPALGHSMTAFEATEPTCTEDGNSAYFFCVNCETYFADENGEQKIKKDSWILPALGHNDGEWRVIEEAGCGKAGYEGRYCTRVNDGELCGCLLEQREIPPIEPDYYVSYVFNAVQNEDGEWCAVRCDELAYLVYTCRICGDTYTVYLDPAEHKPSGWIADEEAYCVHAGHKHVECTVCGLILDEAVIDAPRNGHDYQIVETVISECAAGTNLNHYVCLICGETECDACSLSESPHHYWDGDPAVHDMDIFISAATCTEPGFVRHECKNCDYSYVEIVEALGHDWALASHIDATCMEPGYDLYRCRRDGCDAEDKRIIGESLGHDWGAWTDNGDGNHIRVCKRDESHTETVAHVWDNGVVTKVATCKEQGSKLYTCTVCGAAKTEAIAIDPENHADYGTHIENDKDATCLKKGYTGDTVCNGCGEVLMSGEDIPAHGHDYHKIGAKSVSPDYGVDGYDYYECSYDVEHNYKVIIPALVKATYTVTFVADGETVAVVTYTQGDKFVEEPTAPEKDNYTVEWEDYTLNDSNIIVNAVYTPIDPNNVSEIETEKKIEKFENGVATITLSASAASRLVKFESSSTKPVDVILVLDLSGSMAETLGDSDETKLQALKDCTNSFLTALNDNAVATGADHQVALVGFASGQKVSGYTMTAYQNTGLIVTQNSGFVSYTNAGSYYGSALMPTGDILGVNAKLTDAINGLTAGGSTNTQLGLKMAQNILAQNGGDGREKIVILITDGNPTSASSHRDEIQAVAPLAVTYANEIKDLGVKLYTVGVDAAADAFAAFDSTVDGIAGTGKYDRINNKNKEVVTFDFNRFLNIVSSNYSDAAAMNNYGERVNDGYYMSVTDTGNLNEIFSKILVSSVYEKLSFYRCTIVDTLGKDFVLTLEQEYALRDRLAADYNIPDSNISVIRNDDGTTTLRIEGVPSVKTVVDGKTVYRASVSFDASLAAYQSGSYETNTANAYVELNEERVASFAVPRSLTVETNRNIVVFKLNGEVYRIEEGSLGDEIAAPATDLASWVIADGTVITGNYAEFEMTEINTNSYTVTWDIDGEKTVETYAFGEKIRIPAVADQDGLEFAGFSPAVPHIMPARNMTFTAVYAPKHVHSFKQTAIKGTCTEGLIIVSACACGETQEKQVAVREHQFSAIVGESVGNALTDTLVCSICHATEQHTLTFQTATTSRGKTTVLDLSLKKDGTLIQPAAGSTVKIMIPWTNQGNTAASVKVYRVNEQGVQATYTATVENGYLVFYADHFSIYVVEELDDNGNEIEQVSYERAICELNGTHAYELSATEKATCTKDGFELYICPECGDTYTNVLPQTDHHDANKDGKCDDCGTVLSGGSTDTGSKCPYCGKDHGRGFGKIIQFFHSILYFFKRLFGG